MLAASLWGESMRRTWFESLELMLRDLVMSLALRMQPIKVLTGVGGVMSSSYAYMRIHSNRSPFQLFPCC